MKLIHILNQLMEAQGLSLDKLAKLTGVGRSNINRMRTTPDCNPTITSLLPIAKFFQVSVEQLIGEKPIHDQHKYQLNSLNIEKLPILKTYNQVFNFLENNATPKNPSYTYAENPVSEKAFGYIVTDNSMQPIFPKNIIVIFDANEYFNNNSFVLALDLKKEQIILKKYINENGLKLLLSLKSTDTNTTILKPSKTIKIVATAIECHMDLLK